MSTFTPHAHCTKHLPHKYLPRSLDSSLQLHFLQLLPRVQSSQILVVLVKITAVLAQPLNFKDLSQSHSSTGPLPYSSVLSLSQTSPLSGFSALSAVLVKSNTTQIPIMQIPNRPPLNEPAENKTKNVLQTHLFSLPFCLCLWF